MTANESGPAEDDGRTEGAIWPAGRSSRRRRLTLGGAAALLVAVLVALALVTGTKESGTSVAAGRSAASGSAASASAAPGSAAPGSTAPVGTTTSAAPPPAASSPTAGTTNVDELPPALPVVALAATATESDGIAATLPKIEAIQGTGTGPGNVDGPAVRVTVQIQNGTARAVSLDGVAVNMYYGPDRTPASPLDDPSTRRFTGTVAAGKAGQGVYVFSVPADDRRSITVEVGYQPGAPLLLFTGPVN